jgi:CHAD domain-containing protein
MAHLFHQAASRPRPAAASAGKGGAHAGEFGARLAEAAAAGISDARRALNKTGSRQPEAVHALRKAFKRWRALLRLLQASIGAPARDMRGKARSLMRELSSARDAQAALDALDDLTKGDAPIASSSLNTMHARMAQFRNAAGTSAFTPELRARIGRYLDEAALATERWNLADIPFNRIADGLTKTYRRAHKLVSEDWHEAEPEQLHELRRRVVEHRHQIDLIEPLPKRWSEEAQRLRTHLGACQDLMVLAHFVQPHRALAPWRSRLTPAIAARRAAHLRRAERIAARLFAEKPKAFRKRVTALCDARETRKKPGG